MFCSGRLHVYEEDEVNVVASRSPSIKSTASLGNNKTTHNDESMPNGQFVNFFAFIFILM
jgi:hypothetical protein